MNQPINKEKDYCRHCNLQCTEENHCIHWNPAIPYSPPSTPVGECQHDVMIPDCFQCFPSQPAIPMGEEKKVIYCEHKVPLSVCLWDECEKKYVESFPVVEKLIINPKTLCIQHGTISHTMKESVDCESCIKTMNDFSRAKEDGTLDKILSPSTPHVEEWAEAFDEKFSDRIFVSCLKDKCEGCEAGGHNVYKEGIIELKSFISTLLLKENKEWFDRGFNHTQALWEESLPKRIAQAKKEEREEIMREIEGMMKETHPVMSVEELDIVEAYNSVYNQAITDLKERLSKRIN